MKQKYQLINLLILFSLPSPATYIHTIHANINEKKNAPLI